MNDVINFIKKDIYLDFDKFINKFNNFCVWLSWWPDSMFLLYLLISYFELRWFDKSRLKIFHYNHWYREESKVEEEILKNKFANYNLIVWYYNWSNFDENSLRKSRYDFFKKNMNDNDLLFLWHNLTDRIETTFLNMLRWCDLSWFLNMKKNVFVNWINIYRPLLSISKLEIEEMCKLNKIEFFVDKSNCNNKLSLRNYVRNEILSKLYSISNKSDDVILFQRSFENIYNSLDLNEYNNFSLLEINDVLLPSFLMSDDIYFKKISCDIKDVDDLVKLIKYYWIYKNITRPLLFEFFSFIKNSSTWYKSLWWLYFIKSYSDLYIFYKKNKNYNIISNLTLNYFDCNYIKITKTWEYNFFWYNIIVNNNDYLWTVLRFPKKWDYYKNKTLNQHFKKNKVPYFLRKIVPVFEKNLKIIWILDWKNLLK